MSANEQLAQPAAGAAAETTTDISVADICKATRHTEPSRTKDLIGALIEKALEGTVTWDKNVSQTIKAGMSAIDEALSQQLAAIMHDAEFQKLEGSWRGLHHLVFNSETNTMLKIKVLNVSKRELYKDVDKAPEFDQSQAFKKLYENEFGMPGGEPYGVLLGDYEFTNHPEDIDLLSKMSNVAAAAFCPFISAAAPRLLGFDDWTELADPRDLEQIFETKDYIKWKSYRATEDSRFVTLVLPRVLARLPYGEATSKVEEFKYEEVELDDKGRAKPVPHNHFTWMNAAYVMGTQLTGCFSRHHWCTAIRGAEGGGKVEGLPAFVFKSDDGDLSLKCPTEIAITGRREAELSKCGFLPLCHYKNTDYAVFFGGQTTQKPKKYQGQDGPAATANAAISARLPYMMATSRIAHYLKVMARDWIGSFYNAETLKERLNNWIRNYTNSSKDASQEMKAKFPLIEARIDVSEIPGSPGSYNAKAFLRPHLQLEELTAALSMVAALPKPQA